MVNRVGGIRDVESALGVMLPIVVVAWVLVGCGATFAAENLSGGEASPIGEMPEASALIRQAREVYEANRSTEPPDECVINGNWKYEVLHILSRAVELDPDQTLAELATGNFDFRNGGIYGKWRAAVTREWTHDRLTRLLVNRDWWPLLNSFPPYWLEFAEDGRLLMQSLGSEENVGSWRLDNGVLSISAHGQGSLRMSLKTLKSYFNSGRSWYFTLTLEAETEDLSLPWNAPLILGPRVGDCGEYNF